jgi:hypothetical protein
MNHLQHTSKTYGTLETYICNIKEGRSRPVDSDLGVGASGERWHASTTGMAFLVDALGSSGIDMRRTTAPPAPAEAGGAPDDAVASGVGGCAAVGLQ